MRFDPRIIATLALTCALASTGEAKTLTYCADGVPEGFDPALFTSAATFDASSQTIYDRLVAYGPGTTKIEPGLALRWEVSEDGLTYTFHLRHGVRFQTTADFTPTRPFNADDVVFTFDRQMNEGNPFYAYAGGQWPYFTGMSMDTTIESIDKVDDYTVRFVLTRPQASFLDTLAMDFASIMSKEYADSLVAEDRVADLNLKPVGTGPFQFAGYEADVTVRYVANRRYWRGRPDIDDLVFIIVPDARVRWQKLKAGGCQVMADPEPADIKAMRADEDITMVQAPRLDIAYLAYNTTQVPFDDARVRRALNMAIDKQAIVAAVYQDAGVAAKTPIPPAIWAYNDAVTEDRYDPEAARTMLEEAGVAGLTIKVWAMTRARPYNPDAAKMAEMIKADLDAIGVKVEIVTEPWGEYLRQTSAADREGAVLFGWTGDNGDPDNFLGVLLSCAAVGASNRAQWCYEPFNELLVKARSATDQEQRKAFYARAQTIFKREAPWLTIAHSLATVAMRKEVEGYVMDPVGRHNFAGVDLAEAED